MIFAHVMGMPVEESALAVAPAGAAILAGAAVVARAKLAGIAGWLRRRLLRYERKLKDGATPFLEDGEEVVSAVIAAPHGYTQSVAGSMNLGSEQQGWAGREASVVDRQRALLACARSDSQGRTAR